MPGLMRIEGIASNSSRMIVTFQNANLIAHLGSNICAIIPHLVHVLDREMAEPISTELPWYRPRPSIMSVNVPAAMRTPEALAMLDPTVLGPTSPFHTDRDAVPHNGTSPPMIPRKEYEEPSWARHCSFSEIVSAIWHPAHDCAFPLADRGPFSHSALHSLSLVDKGT